MVNILNNKIITPAYIIFVFPNLLIKSPENKEGKNIDNLHLILSQIPNRDKWKKEEVDGSIVYIDSTFQVPGIGLVLSGMVKGENIDVDSSGLSKREWNELMTAFDLKDKLI